MRVDLTTVDQTQFNLSEREGLVLITPRKDKHVWEDHELWYRSLLCDSTGLVVSCGFPKFMNYHEKPTEHAKALEEATQIDVMSKMDGSLLIVSKQDGRVYIRTRGNNDLGDFHDPVMKVLEQYPRVLAGVEGVSLLFEYVAPDNQIVVPYAIPDIYFLGYVEHGTSLKLYCAAKDLYVYDLGCEVVFEYIDIQEHILQSVPKWKDDEGVVVSCHNDLGFNPVLFKVKSDWYVMMHALRFQMTPRKMKQLLTVEKLPNFESLQQYLYSYGYDFEVAEILKNEAEKFFAALDFATGMCVLMSEWCRNHEHLTRGEFVQAYRKTFVPKNTNHEWLFHYAMASYDKRGLTLLYPYAQACGESVRKIQIWMETPGLIQQLLKTPQNFEETDDDI